MKILIAGSDINAILTAQYIKLQDNSLDIYLTSDRNDCPDVYTNIDIKENDVNSLKDFAKYNEIDFTIATSKLAIINGISEAFITENLKIFAPGSEASRITFFNSIAKKIMYKLKINTPKFGIFDRENLACEYARNAQYPICIENDFTLIGHDYKVYRSFSKAKAGIKELFENTQEKTVIQNYIDKDPVYLYFVTDGYNALPLAGIKRDETGFIKTYSALTQEISSNILLKILNTAIYPLLDDISKYSDPYIGIIGMKIKIVNEVFYVLEFYNGFQENDFQSFLSILNDNLLDIYIDAERGNVTEKRNYIELSDSFSYTISVPYNMLNSEASDEEDDYFITEYGGNITVSAAAPTLNRAVEHIERYVNYHFQPEAVKLFEEHLNKRNQRI